MRGRDAIERQLQFLPGQCAPWDEGGLDAGLLFEGAQDAVSIGAAVELREARGKQRLAPPLKVSFEQVRGRCVEFVEERAREWREDGVPTQEAEQGVDQGVLDVEDRGVRGGEMGAYGELDALGRVGRLPQIVLLRRV